MDTAPTTFKSYSYGSAPSIMTTPTVLPSTRRDAGTIPLQKVMHSHTSGGPLMLPAVYRQIISLHLRTPDQQDIEEWDRARVNLKLRRSKLLAAVSNAPPILLQCI